MMLAPGALTSAPEHLSEESPQIVFPERCFPDTLLALRRLIDITGG